MILGKSCYRFLLCNMTLMLNVGKSMMSNETEIGVQTNWNELGTVQANARWGKTRGTLPFSTTTKLGSNRSRRRLRKPGTKRVWAGWVSWTWSHSFTRDALVPGQKQNPKRALELHSKLFIHKVNHPLFICYLPLCTSWHLSLNFALCKIKATSFPTKWHRKASRGVSATLEVHSQSLLYGNTVTAWSLHYSRESHGTPFWKKAAHSNSDCIFWGLRRVMAGGEKNRIFLKNKIVAWKQWTMWCG